MSVLEHALKYATAMNWRVFPVGQDKKPLIKEWQKRATTEESQIREWWEQHPSAGVAVACGPDSGIWVLDVDLPDGPKQLRALEVKNQSLPETLCQRTGSGGVQYIFKWNGHEIRNSASKVGKDLDVRGAGGYVVLPPSIHPTGNEYQWLRKSMPGHAPSWLYGLIGDHGKPKSNTETRTAATASEYGRKALAAELAGLSMATEGTRNDSLNKSAFRMGQLVGGGELCESQVEASLIGVALAIGLDATTSKKTIASGMGKGKDEPRRRESDPLWNGQPTDITDTADITDKADSTDTNGHQRTPTDTNGQPTDNQRTTNGQADNVKNAVKEWILLDNRQFSVRDIYFDLGATNRQQKKNISDYLSAFCREGLIERVGGQRGVFTCVSKEKESFNILDFSLEEEEDFLDLHLPLNMGGIVGLMPGNICVVAGESNAGKTSLLMDWAFYNLSSSRNHTGLVCNSSSMPVHYFSSEMGPREMKMRAKAFGHPASAWAALKTYERSENFHQVIDPDGLNFIDFLEIHDEFYKIGAKIRAIHETMRAGICVIAIQKKRGADYGRGGEMSLEKPRLYISLSEAVKGVSVATIQKAKNYITPFNPNGMQIDFRIENKGSTLIPMTDWRFVKKAEREELNQQYEKQMGLVAGNDEAVKFKTVEGHIVQVIPRDIEKWQSEMPGINVRSELEFLSDTTFTEKTWFKKKSFFFQLASILKKANDTAMGVK
jgi:hypothetical protein